MAESTLHLRLNSRRSGRLDVHLTAETVEVLHRGVRVASHIRSYVPAKATTLTEHMRCAAEKPINRGR